MNETLKTLLQAIGISSLLYGVRILFVEIPQIFSSESGSYAQIQAISRLSAMPFLFLMTTGILYCIIAWAKNKGKSKN